LSQIAFEKAGIIKPDIPVILSPQKEEALQTVEKIAEQRQAPLVLVGKDYVFTPQSASLAGQTFTVTATESSETTTLDIRLLGQYQIENATTAFAALQVLRNQGLHISDFAIQEGFSKAKWPARFEILNINPTVVVDSAHNPDSARRIRQAVQEYFPSKPLILILGVSEDKNITGIIEELLPNTTEIICSQSTHPRAMDADKLRDIIAPFGCPVKVRKSMEEALTEALMTAGNKAVVLVTGSIFIAATARIAWYDSLELSWRKDVGLQLASQ